MGQAQPRPPSAMAEGALFGELMVLIRIWKYTVITPDARRG